MNRHTCFRSCEETKPSEESKAPWDLMALLVEFDSLHLLSLTVIKHNGRKQPGGGRAYFTYTSTSQSIIEGSQGRSSRREPGGGN